MKCEKEEVVEYVLRLSETEAEWLKAYVQNGFPTESYFDSEMRREIFESLTEQQGGF